MTKLALVTGGNKGIGYEVSLLLSRTHGFHVLLGARKQQEGEQAAASIREQGGSAEFVQLDVTDDTQIETLRDFIADKYGKLDVLVNNAGITSGGSDPSKNLREKFHSVFNTNVFGPAVLIETLSDLLAKSEHPRIVNVSSGLGSLTAGSTPNSEFYSVKIPDYNASKSALNALTVVYAYQLEKKGIKVNSVDPGYTATDLNGHQGYRKVQEAAESVIISALIGDDGPSGKFFAIDGSTLPW